MPLVPIYEYACTACGERTEARQGFDDPPLEECPRCGGRLRKLYSPVGIVFKGSGFYSTDAKGSGRPSEKKESKPADAKPEKSTSPSTDKPA
jgi:putative FmdB family regulatory protein